MSKHHRDRSWAPAPEPLPEDARTIDNHTHVASVVPFSRAMSHEAEAKGQPPVPVYSVDELLDQAAAVGIEGVIDSGCELPDLMTAVQMALDHPGVVHAALAIHPNESVLHGHRGVPGPDGLELKYKPHHDVPFEQALAEVHRLAVAYPEQVVAIGETGMDFFRTGGAARDLQRQAFRDHIALAKELGLPMQIHDRDAHREVIETLLADGAPEFTVFHSYSGDAARARLVPEHVRHGELQGQRRHPRVGAHCGPRPCDGGDGRAVPGTDAVPRPDERPVHDPLHAGRVGGRVRPAGGRGRTRHTPRDPHRVRGVSGYRNALRSISNGILAGCCGGLMNIVMYNGRYVTLPSWLRLPLHSTSARSRFHSCTAMTLSSAVC